MLKRFLILTTLLATTLSAQNPAPVQQQDLSAASAPEPVALSVQEPAAQPVAVAGQPVASQPAATQPVVAVVKSGDFLQEMNKQWFVLLDTIGVICFALAGLVTAYLWGASLFGTLLLSFLPPFGGGIMRDLILGRKPIGFTQAETNISVVFVIVIIGFFVLGMTKDRSARETKSRDASLLQAAALFDGIGLAIFTVTGTMVAVLLDAQPLWLWGPFAAMLTSTGGGILRDLMLRNHGVAVVNGAIYPEIALFWGWVLSWYISASHTTYADAGVILIGTMLGVFATWAMLRAIKAKNLTFGG